MSEVKLWSWDCKCGGLPIPVTPVTEYQNLKSDYDDLKNKLAQYESGDLPTWKSEHDILKEVCDSLDKYNQELQKDLGIVRDSHKRQGQLNDALYLKQIQLENQNEDLKAKLEKAEAVISFYASEDTWINKEFDENNNFIGWTQKKPNDVSIFPYSIGNSNGNFYCLGRRAREYLKGGMVSKAEAALELLQEMSKIEGYENWYTSAAKRILEMKDEV